MHARSVFSCAVFCLISIVASPARAADYMDQVSGGSPSGMYPSSAASGSACMDDFEIFGLMGGGGGTAQIVLVQAVVRGIVPPAFRVNIYHNLNDPAFTNLRTLQQGDAFTQEFPTAAVQLQPFPVPGESGNFPGSLLLSINLDNVFLPFGSYYLSIVAEQSNQPFFIVGSDTVTEGTPLNLVQISNQGPGGTAMVIADNAAYRVIGVTVSPINDNCAGARPIGAGSFPYTTVGATNDGTGSCAASATSPDIWFDYLAPADGLITFTTCDDTRTYDTAMSIFDACGGIELGCNDDGPPFCALPGVSFSGSTINLAVIAGTHYLVRVSGFNNAVGSSVLHVSGAAGPPANDNCATAAVVIAGSYPFDTTLATNDSNVGACAAATASPDIWFRYTSPTTGAATFSLCGSSYDTALSILDACGGVELACNDDFCGLSSQLSVGVIAGTPVWIRVAGFASDVGTGTLTITDPSGGGPANDSCATAAVAVLGDNAFDTTFADTDGIAGCGFGGDPGGHDVWFSFTAAQTEPINLTTCPGVLDTIVSFLDACGGTELACNDDSPGGLCSTLTASVTSGNVYIIRVAGFGSVAGPGVLTITSAAVGACCTDTGCVFTTAAGCSGVAGTFQGAGTDCGTTTYTSTASTEVLEDIRLTGAISTASNCDDCGEVVSMGMDFSFFTALVSDVAVNSNGFLTFGGPSGSFTNNCPIPSALPPNNFIAPAWDDFNPGAGGEVYYELRGTAPNRRFIVQWTNVAQFANTDSNTFQVILYEGSNNIEFRYGTMTQQVACDITVGVENSDGTAGLDLDATTTIGAGNTAVLITGTTSAGDCDANPCPADFNGDGFRDPDDLADFITCFFLDAQTPGTCPRADFNGDGNRDPDDLADYITIFFTTTC